MEDPVKKIRFWAGFVFGAAIQYLYDPKAGQSRRALLRERLTARLLDAKDRMTGKPVGLGNVDQLRTWRSEAGRSAGGTV